MVPCAKKSKHRQLGTSVHDKVRIAAETFIGWEGKKSCDISGFGSTRQIAQFLSEQIELPSGSEDYQSDIALVKHGVHEIGSGKTG